MPHELIGDELLHWIKSVGIMIGLGASAVGLSYFAIQKYLENKDKKKEYDVFIEDIKYEIYFMTKLYSISQMVWDDTTKTIPKGVAGMVDFYSFEMFNIKYRHLFDKDTRLFLGALKLDVKMYNDDLFRLRDVLIDINFNKTIREQELKAHVIHSNSTLEAISKNASAIYDKLENYKKPNWFKQQYNKLTS